MIKKVYCIIGQANTGKSSLIRALTGVSSHNFNKPIRITFKNNSEENFFVETTASQEPVKKSVEAVIRSIKKSDCNYCIIALRYKTHSKRFPNAEEYLREFKKQRIGIVGVVLLDSIKLSNINSLRIKIPPICIINPKEKSINKNAAFIRNKWKWY